MGSFATVLSGGGARGAYQAGVMRALFEICQNHRNFELFRTLCGVSAGAINACSLASKAEDLDSATLHLCNTWRNLEADQVFHTNYTSVTRNALKVVRNLGFGPLSKKTVSKSIGLLNTQPLSHLIESNIEFDRIQPNLDAGRVRAISATATDYSTALSVTFMQTGIDIDDWVSDNRLSQKAQLSTEHIMASSAIPIFFPPVNVGGRYFGDGSLRNSAPLSPAIHFGADRILVVGVRNWARVTLESRNKLNPSLGRVISVLINAIFLDSVESDLERLQLINKTVTELKHSGMNTELKPIETLYIHPSMDLAELASKHQDKLPTIIRYLFDGLGSAEESSELLSYLMFDSSYCTQLVELGIEDTYQQKTRIEKFLNSSS